MTSFLLALLLLQAEPAAEPPSGQITSIDPGGRSIRASLGKDSGLQSGFGLKILSAPETVALPGTRQTAYVTEREIGTATIVEVTEKDLVAQITRADETLRLGFRVIPAAPVKSGPMPPHIRANVSLDPSPAVWGRESAIRLDIEDLDSDLARVECRVEGGLLRETLGTGREYRWMPPAKAGEVRLFVRATDRQGLTAERTISLSAAGILPDTKPSRFSLEGVFGSPFVQADDLAFDPDGNSYILDRDMRRIVAWSPSGRLLWISDRYGYDLDFIRLVIHAHSAYLLDRASRRVLRYDLNRNLFAAGYTAHFGSPRKAAGSLRRPVDVAVAADGNVWILDQADGTIKTFSPDAEYQTTIGSFTEPSALRIEKGGYSRILDPGSRKIHVFLGSLLVQKIDLSADAAFPVDIEGETLLYRTHLGTVDFHEARLLRRDPFGRAYVIADEGLSVFRLDARGNPAGSRHARREGVLTAVRATSDGGFFVQNDHRRWTYDPDGWLIATSTPEELTPRREKDDAGRTYAMDRGISCDNIPLDVGTAPFEDFDIDPFGRILVLERGSGRVLRLVATGLR